MEEIDKELQKQKEMKGMYKMRLERTQLFLKYCLQVAQDNGFLDLILNKDKDQEFLLSPTITQSSINTPQIPSPGQSHPDLAPLINQAKISGWYIDPQEVIFFFFDFFLQFSFYHNNSRLVKVLMFSRLTML